MVLYNDYKRKRFYVNENYSVLFKIPEPHDKYTDLYMYIYSDHSSDRLIVI